MQLELIHQAIISLCQPDMLQIGGVLMEPIFPSHLSQYKTVKSPRGWEDHNHAQSFFADDQHKRQNRSAWGRLWHIRQQSDDKFIGQRTDFKRDIYLPFGTFVQTTKANSCNANTSRADSCIMLTIRETNISRTDSCIMLTIRETNISRADSYIMLIIRESYHSKWKHNPTIFYKREGEGRIIIGLLRTDDVVGIYNDNEEGVC